MSMMDEFFRAVDEVGFKFWVCPHGCCDFVDWIGDRATCRKCGTDNHGMQATPARLDLLDSKIEEAKEDCQVMKITMKRGIPKEPGQYLCKRPSSLEPELVHVWLNPLSSRRVLYCNIGISSYPLGSIHPDTFFSEPIEIEIETIGT